MMATPATPSTPANGDTEFEAFKRKAATIVKSLKENVDHLQREKADLEKRLEKETRASEALKESLTEARGQGLGALGELAKGASERDKIESELNEKLQRLAEEKDAAKREYEAYIASIKAEAREEVARLSKALEAAELEAAALAVSAASERQEEAIDHSSDDNPIIAELKAQHEATLEQMRTEFDARISQLVEAGKHMAQQNVHRLAALDEKLAQQIALKDEIELEASNRVEEAKKELEAYKATHERFAEERAELVSENRQLADSLAKSQDENTLMQRLNAQRVKTLEEELRVAESKAAALAEEAARLQEIVTSKERMSGGEGESDPPSNSEQVEELELRLSTERQLHAALQMEMQETQSRLRELESRLEASASAPSEETSNAEILALREKIEQMTIDAEEKKEKVRGFVEKTRKDRADQEARLAQSEQERLAAVAELAELKAHASSSEGGDAPSTTASSAELEQVKEQLAEALSQLDELDRRAGEAHEADMREIRVLTDRLELADRSHAELAKSLESARQQLQEQGGERASGEAAESSATPFDAATQEDLERRANEAESLAKESQALLAQSAETIATLETQLREVERAGRDRAAELAIQLDLAKNELVAMNAMLEDRVAESAKDSEGRVRELTEQLAQANALLQAASAPAASADAGERLREALEETKKVKRDQASAKRETILMAETLDKLRASARRAESLTSGELAIAAERCADAVHALEEYLGGADGGAPGHRGAQGASRSISIGEAPASEAASSSAVGGDALPELEKVLSSLRQLEKRLNGMTDTSRKLLPRLKAVIQRAQEEAAKEIEAAQSAGCCAALTKFFSAPVEGEAGVATGKSKARTAPTRVNPDDEL